MPKKPCLPPQCILRGRLILLIALIALLTTPLLNATAGTVITRDGQRLSGELHLKGSDLIVSAHEPDREIVVPLDSVEQAVFNAPAVPANHSPPPPARSTPKKTTKVAPGGIKAEYFADKDLKDLRLVRREENILNSWTAGAAPVAEVPQRFAARWSGALKLPRYETAKTRTLFLDCDGGIRFWLNGKLEVDTWDDHPHGSTAQIDVEAGELYEYKLEYFHEAGEGHAHLLMTTIDRQAKRALKSWYFTPRTGENAPPEIEITSPASGEASLADQPITLTATAKDPDGSIRSVRFYDNGQLVGESTKAPYSIVLTKTTAGAHVLTAQAVDNQGLSTSSPSVTYCASASLGDGWGLTTVTKPPVVKGPAGKHVAIDIADLKPLPPDASEPARAAMVDGILSLTHSGGDLRSDADSFGCVFKTIEGDFELSAKLISMDCKDPEAQALAGLVIQEDFVSSAPRASLMVGQMAEKLTAIQLNRAHQKLPEWVPSKIDALPVWLRLVRTGHAIYTYTSTDGQRWVAVGTAQTILPGRLRVGFAAATRDNSSPVTATFDHLLLSEWHRPMESTTGGLLLADGTFIDETIASLTTATLDADTLHLRISHHTQPTLIPRSRLSRICYKPLPSEATNSIPPGQAGALTTSGDFLEAAIDSLANGQVTTSSVLFGKKVFHAKSDLLGLIFQTPPTVTQIPEKTRYILSTTGGSRIYAVSLQPHDKQLMVEEPELGSLTIAASAVQEIRGVPITAK